MGLRLCFDNFLVNHPSCIGGGAVAPGPQLQSPFVQQQECLARVSSQECPARVSSKECPARVSKQECQERASGKSVQQERQARVSKSIQQECQAQVSAKCLVPTKQCPASVSSTLLPHTLSLLDSSLESCWTLLAGPLA